MKTFRISEGMVVAMMSFGTLALTASLWRSSAVLALALALFHCVCFALLKAKKQYLAIYAVAFIAGPLAEALCIYFGAWSYNTPHILGVPIWLGMVWGAAGILFANLAVRLETNEK